MTPLFSFFFKLRGRGLVLKNGLNFAENRTNVSFYVDVIKLSFGKLTFGELQGAQAKMGKCFEVQYLHHNNH